jgi:hypothetical protein
MEYEKITIDSKKIVNDYISRLRILTSDYSLPVLLTWLELKEPEYSEYKDTLYMRAKLDGRRIYFAPMTLTRFPEAVEDILEESERDGVPFEIILALEDQVAQLDAEKYYFSTNRDYAEYLYLSEDLINLTGKKYHAKRNHINRFNSLYSCKMRSYAPSDRPGIMEQLRNWGDGKDGDSEYELNMINYFFDHMNELDIFADVIESDGKIIGAAIGEISHPDMGIVMYEKCDFSYEGICAAINQMFAEKHFKHVKYINRQEDIGIPGLRKAKLSYNPVKLIYRYTIKRIEKV